MISTIITPNDPLVMGSSDSESIQNAIHLAVQNSHTVRIPRINERTQSDTWVIDKTILLPSDITIILDNCHLRLADGVYENIFRNSNAYEPIGRTSEGTQHNIHIIGIGNAVLDGGNHNGLFEQTFRKLGLPHPMTGNLILFINVQDFVLEKFCCANMRYWAINQMYCSHGRISNIHFVNGPKLHNQDGIHVCGGCSELIIENITGLTGDDVIGLTAFPWEEYARFRYDDANEDIHDVYIRNVKAHTRQSVVSLRAVDGAKLYRIHIEEITDVGGWTPEYGAWGVVRIGEVNYYKEYPAQPGDIYEITVNGVHSQCRGTVFLGCALKDSHISNVYAGGSSMHAISTFMNETVFWENGCMREGGITMENVVIENIHYNAVPGFLDDANQTVPGTEWHGAALDFRCMRKTDYLKNVIFRNIFARDGADIAVCKEGFKLDIRN